MAAVLKKIWMKNTIILKISDNLGTKTAGRM